MCISKCIILKIYNYIKNIKYKQWTLSRYVHFLKFKLYFFFTVYGICITLLYLYIFCNNAVLGFKSYYLFRILFVYTQIQK